MTVPIEIGAIGTLKFLVKTLVYRYSLEELPGNISWKEYFCVLIKGGRISQFRDIRKGWGTHFGFDYRDIDSLLELHSVRFRAVNKGTSRFYFLDK